MKFTPCAAPWMYQPEGQPTPCIAIRRRFHPFGGENGLGIKYVVDTPLGAREITLVLTVAATVTAGMAGWLVVAALQHYAAHPLRIWIAVGIVVLAASIVPVFLTPAALATQLVLSVQHCVAAAILIPALPQTRRG